MNVSSIKPVKKTNSLFYLPKSSPSMTSIDNKSCNLSMYEESDLDSTRWYQLSPIKYGTQKYDSDSDFDSDKVHVIIRNMQNEISSLKHRITELESIIKK